MSLYVCLNGEPPQGENPQKSAIPTSPDVTTILFWDNITHNLGPMANAANLFKPIWEPDEIGISKAHQLITPLTTGLNSLKSDPGKFKKLSPSNGWGTYDNLIDFVTNYLNAAIQFPDADVSVSR